MVRERSRTALGLGVGTNVQNQPVRVTTLQVTNYRSFVGMEPIDLGQVNVFIGPNNAGKSSLLRAVSAMQEGLANLPQDARIGASAASVEIGLGDVHGVAHWGQAGECDSGTLRINLGDSGINFTIAGPQGNGFGVHPLPAVEPNHFVVPYLSKRKAITYSEDVREQYALQIRPQFDFLAAKLSRLGNPGFPDHARYAKTCEEILGFVVTAVPSPNGQRPGVYLPDRRTLAIEQMGEGVPNIVGLLADLALSDGKLFVVEEPENDLHPRALKALLDLMLESAGTNQFLVSTHSNIVARHLVATDDSRLFYVDAKPGSLPPVATVRSVEPTPQARLAVLRDLGYSFSDFDLWDGWIMLEESSAERIIRDYLIPWFAPRLARVRTLSAGGNSQVEPTFDDFHRLVRFTHLEEAYRDAAWVRVDGDEQGEAIVQRLRQRYASWAPDRFKTFSAAQFESYYPTEFAERTAEVLAFDDRRRRREEKRQLLDEVRAWLDADLDRGKEALGSSAAEVIEDLHTIEEQLRDH
jgi:hypothetical protein